VEPENLSHAVDEALITRHASGSPSALSELFKRYASLVRNVGKKILRNDCEADDLVQEVFLYLHRKSRLFDSAKGTGRSWIIQVAYTQALLRRRALKTHGFYLSETASRLVDGDRAGSGAGQEYDHTLEGLFGRNGRKKIIGQLTEDQRETLRLHFFEGLTFAEIAERLGQSHRNIRNHHYRGLEKLRKHIVKSKLNVV
jgi:RNA polymerase sigma-70 factor (ECF subfamily)